MNGRIVEIWIGLGQSVASAYTWCGWWEEMQGCLHLQSLIHDSSPPPPRAGIKRINSRILPLFKEAFCGRPVEPFGVVNSLPLKP